MWRGGRKAKPNPMQKNEKKSGLCLENGVALDCSPDRRSAPMSELPIKPSRKTSNMVGGGLVEDGVVPWAAVFHRSC